MLVWAAVALAATATHATTTWTNAFFDEQWSNPDNWTAGVPNSFGDVVFPGGVPGNHDVFLLGLNEAQSLAFADDYQLMGGSLSLNLGEIDVDPFVVASISSGLGGFNGLTKLGDGTLMLSGLNQYAGSTNVSGGTLAVSTFSQLISDATEVTIDGGATLRFDAGADIETIGSLAGFGQVEFANPAGTNLKIGFNGFDTVFNGVIIEPVGTSSLTKLGSGMLTLAGNNDFGGSVSIEDGTLNLTGSNTYAAGTQLNGGTLKLGHNLAAGTGPIGVNVPESLIQYDAGIQVNNAIALHANAVLELLTLDATHSGNIGETGGAFKITKSGPAMLTLTGNNTYTGGTVVNGGTLEVGSNTAVSTGPITMNSGGIRAAFAPRTLANTLEINGSFTLGRLTHFTGPIHLNNSATIFIDNYNAPANAFSDLAAISETGGARKLTIQNGPLFGAGTGGIRLTGVNTYTGGTTVNSGRLVVAPTGKLPSTGAVTVDGGELKIEAGANSPSGAVDVVTGTLQLEGALTPSGNVNVVSGGTLNIQNTGVLNGNGANGPIDILVVATPGSPGRSITSAGTFAVSGSGSQINLKGGTGGGNLLASSFGPGGAGGTLSITGGTATLSNSVVVNMNGGNGILLNNAANGSWGGTGGTLSISGGAASISGASLLNLTGGNGANGGNSFGDGGSGGAGGTLSISGGAASLSGTSLLNLTGGNAGSGIGIGANGGNGGAGGTLSISGGSASILGASLLNLTGGNAGSGIGIGANGGNGGAGGSVLQSNGVFSMTGGRIILAGGSGGANGTFGTPGGPGAAGHVDITGGTFNFTAGQITADTGITPATPAAVVKSTLNVNGGTANINAPLDLVQATVNLSAGELNAVAINRNTSAFNFTGGTLHVDTFNGSLTQNGGALASGATVHSTTITGDYTQNSGSLAIEIGGTMPGIDYDRVGVEGMANLMGTLDVTLTNSFVPTLGDSFGFLFAIGGFSSNFSAMNLPDISSLGLYWQLDPGELTISLNVVDTLPGDFDMDGDVDGRDFVVWQRDQSVGSLNDWQMNFGMTAALSASGTAVPEPSAIWLCLGVAWGLAARRTFR